MKNIFVLASDGSESSERAVEYCRRVLDPEQFGLLVINVARPIPTAMEDDLMWFDNDPSELREMALAHAQDVATDTANQLQSHGFGVEVEARVGHPGREICDFAESRDATGIVMGRRGRGPVGEILLGSVSHYVIHHANCPVTVVPL